MIIIFVKLTVHCDLISMFINVKYQYCHLSSVAQMWIDSESVLYGNVNITPVRQSLVVSVGPNFQLA